MAIGGLWETWTGPNGEEVDTACIVTTHANGPISAIHHRMPVILEPEHFDTWLDCEAHDADEASLLMRPAENDVLEFWPISTAVNKVVNDGPELMAPVGEIERAEPKPRQAANPPAQGDLFG
jgi:putative SOS response-associated peptidase YedK